MLLLFRIVFTGRILLDLTTPSHKSLLGCSMDCYNVRRCQSFFYIQWNKTCSIAYRRFEHTNVNLTGVEGAQYREKTNYYCPPDYTVIPEASMCIKLRLNYTINKRTCSQETHGGRLAILDTGAKYTAVIDYLAGHTAGFKESVLRILVGGTIDIAIETALRSGLIMWCPHNHIIASDDCLEMVKLTKIKEFCLNAINCSSRKGFLCEKPMNIIE